MQLLQENRLEELDYDSIFQMLFEMSRSEKNSIEGLSRIIVMHLLKWVYQPEKRTRSWRTTILSHRYSLLSILEDSKILGKYLQDHLEKIYSRAKRLASSETEIPEENFPTRCPFTVDQILDDEFFG